MKTLFCAWLLLLRQFIALPLSAQRVVYVSASSTNICQLTGETDRQFNMPTFNRTESNYHLRGTDLGSIVEHNGRAYFFFGDTQPAAGLIRPRDSDNVAYTTDIDPEGCLHLQFLSAGDGGYASPQIQNPSVSLAGFEVPTGGFSVNGNLYVFFTTDHVEADHDQHIDLMGRCVLTRLVTS